MQNESWPIFSQPTRHSGISETRADGLPSFFGGQVSPPLIRLLLKICPGRGAEVQKQEGLETEQPIHGLRWPRLPGTDAWPQPAGKSYVFRVIRRVFYLVGLPVQLLYQDLAGRARFPKWRNFDEWACIWISHFENLSPIKCVSDISPNALKYILVKVHQPQIRRLRTGR